MFSAHNQSLVHGQTGRASTRVHGVYRPENIEIRPERVLRIMGYRSGPVRPAVQRVTSAMAELAMSAMSPVVYDCRMTVERCVDDGLLLADGAFFGGPIFVKYLAGCDAVVAFILTLGGRFDNIERNLVDGGNMLEAVLLEAAGWVAIEEATRLYAQTLSATVRRAGLIPTRRLAPGYTFRIDGQRVAWPLEDQKLLFGLFTGVSLPVALLESCAMTPKMSRTGLFGLRPQTQNQILPETNCTSLGAD